MNRRGARWAGQPLGNAELSPVHACERPHPCARAPLGLLAIALIACGVWSCDGGITLSASQILPAPLDGGLVTPSLAALDAGGAVAREPLAPSDGGPSIEPSTAPSAATDGGPAAEDAGPGEVGAPAVGTVLEVGSGEYEFAPFPAGGGPELVCGPQGGQHMFLSVRARGLGPQRVSVAVSVSEVETGRPVCAQRIDDTNLFVADDWAEYTGIICFVPDPERVSGRSVRVTGSITDRAGATESAAIDIVPWGPRQRCGYGP